MALELKYNERLRGAKALSVRDGAPVFYGIIDHGTIYNIKKNHHYYTTGYYYQVDWYQYIQTEYGVYILVDYMEDDNPYWKLYENAVTIPTHSDRSAQKLVDQIIRNNKIILSNNLLCARFANKLTEAQRNRVRELQERLQARNEALQAEGLIEQDSITKDYPAGYAELSAYLDRLMAGEAIGVAISTIVWIVVTAVVLTGLGTAAYYAYRTLAEESEQDVKYSKELNEILQSKLTAEEYAQLKSETAGLITKAKVKQLFSNYKDMLTYAAIAFLGYSIFKIIKNRD